MILKAVDYRALFLSLTSARSELWEMLKIVRTDDGRRDRGRTVLFQHGSAIGAQQQLQELHGALRVRGILHMVMPHATRVAGIVTIRAFPGVPSPGITTTHVVRTSYLLWGPTS